MTTEVTMSFKERLASRRRELESSTSFVLPVPGYEDLYARYRVLGFEDMRGIGKRIEGETDNPITGEILTAAETLAAACEGLLECTSVDPSGKQVFQDLGFRWTAAAANDLFDISLPEGVQPREALLQIFPYPRDMLLMTHFQEFLEQGMNYLPRIEEVIQGESPAA